MALTKNITISVFHLLPDGFSLKLLLMIYFLEATTPTFFTHNFAISVDAYFTTTTAFLVLS